MPAEVLVSAVVVLIGAAAALYFALWALWEGVRVLGRGLGWLFDIRLPDENEPQRTRHVTRICASPGCGHVESRPARFCARCGRRFE